MNKTVAKVGCIELKENKRKDFLSLFHEGVYLTAVSKLNLEAAKTEIGKALEWFDRPKVLTFADLEVGDEFTWDNYNIKRRIKIDDNSYIEYFPNGSSPEVTKLESIGAEPTALVKLWN